MMPRTLRLFAFAILILPIYSPHLWLLAASIAVWTPQDNYLINCGARENTTIDGRIWQGDHDSTYVSGSEEILASTVTENSALPSQQPFLTARVFTSPSAYTFSVVPGKHWLRLYFYPFSFVGFVPRLAIFSVTANHHTLFSTNLVAELRNLNSSYIIKEYSLNLKSRRISIKFFPEGGDDSFAFINGLEVVSMPDNRLAENAMLVGSTRSEFSRLTDVLLETKFRFNVRREAFSSVNGVGSSSAIDSKCPLAAASSSTAGQVPSSSYTYSWDVLEGIATHTIYRSARALSNSNTSEGKFNLSWKFPIDVKSTYYIRLHFCELVNNETKQRVFNVNSQSQRANADMIGRRLQMHEPKYLDYVLSPLAKPQPFPIQLVADHDNKIKLSGAILHGIEIFKVTNFKGLGSAATPAGSNSSPPSSHNRKFIWIVIGGCLGCSIALGVFLRVCWCFFRRNHGVKVFPRPSPSWFNIFHFSSTTKHGNRKPRPELSNNGSNASREQSHASSLSFSVATPLNRPCRLFSLQQIRTATNNFDDDLLLGGGGFGKVYKGLIDSGLLVAIKRGDTQSDQGAREFRTEIELLSKLRHRHLVSLIGFCDEDGEMILVYEYVPNGTLRSHLESSHPFLSWRQRLEICIGAARGLHYLHTGIAEGIIHRDVKSTNILLGDRFVAKMADFGLSKRGPALDKSHVSTRVKGSFGYLDPEYFRTQRLTEKSDVYSFGVVLIEVVSARPVIFTSSPSRGPMNLAEWALRWQKKGMPEKIVDDRLKGTYSTESLDKVLQIAGRCLQDKARCRPAMGDVLWHLEDALRLQRSFSTGGRNNLRPEPPEPPLRLPDLEVGKNSAGKEESDGGECHPIEHMVEEKAAMDLFSQFFVLEGR